MLSDPVVSVLLVEHRDGLTGFGFEHLAAGGRRVVVLGDAETSDDLVRDVTEVLTWLWARLCGRRAAVAVASGSERP